MIVAVAGLRTAEAADACTSATIRLRVASGVERIFFDTCAAVMPVQPASLMARALACGDRLETSRIAILADHDDDTYARIWRKGLADTGHTAIVFTAPAQAQAWLLTNENAETLYMA